MKKIIIFYLNLLFLIFSCQKKELKKDPFLLSHLSRVQLQEKQDHNFCASLKLNFDESNNLNNQAYWHCRLSMAKNHLSTDNFSPQTQQNNAEISDLITKISLKISQISESILSHENNKMDERHHKKCLDLGYVFATDDQAKIDEYFACRKVLIDDQISVPAFGNLEYLDYPNNSYNLGFVVDKRIDAEIKNYDEKKAKYPNCIKFNLYEVNFKNCAAAQDKSRACFGEIEKKKFRKEWEEKILCQKQSYTKFGDELLKKDEAKKAELERIKLNSNFYNNNSFAALRLDESQFGSNKQNDLEIKKVKKNINSKENLYSKFELTRLRKQYISSCQKEADLRLKKYVEEFEKDCANLAKFEVLGEE
jgi:hypothetical protein